MLANYLRALGYQARSHSEATSDIDLRRLAVRSRAWLIVSGDDGSGGIVNPAGSQTALAWPR